MSVDQRIREGLRATNTMLPPSDTHRALGLVTAGGGKNRSARRVAVGAAVVLLAGAAVAASQIGDSSSEPRPAEQSAPAFVGGWMSVDRDGSAQTMTIRETTQGAYEMVLRDDFTGPCNGPSTDTGRGELRGGVLFVRDIETVCEDGRRWADGPSLDFEALPGDTIRDNVGVVWSREDASRPDPTPVPPSVPLFVGSWMSADIDGSSQTMTIRETSRGVFEMILRDNFTGPCTGPSTDTGTGGLQGGNLVVTDIKTVCEDGGGPEGAATSLDFAHDRASDTLRDNVGVVWSRGGPANAG